MKCHFAWDLLMDSHGSTATLLQTFEMLCYFFSAGVYCLLMRNR